MKFFYTANSASAEFVVTFTGRGHENWGNFCYFRNWESKIRDFDTYVWEAEDFDGPDTGIYCMTAPEKACCIRMAQRGCGDDTIYALLLHDDYRWSKMLHGFTVIDEIKK